MIPLPKVVLSWSSGKDSAWALHVLRQRDDVEVVGLLTTLNQKAGRVAMHAVREQLLELQAEALGLPLYKVWIPEPCSNEEYEAAMRKAVARALADGVTHMAFGDLYLEDVRDYRIDKLAGTGLEPIFPIWGLDTTDLAQTMVREGLRAHVTCVDPRVLDRSFAGRTYDADFVADLPEAIDPCGENGEFHSFVFDGPMFETPLPVVATEIVERGGFVFSDVILRESGDSDRSL